MKVSLFPASHEREHDISSLVQASFLELVASYWEPSAQRTFLQESSPDAIRRGIQGGEFSAVAKVDGELMGFILLPSPDVVGMFFVRPGSVRKGIGSALWQAAKEHLAEHRPCVKAVELNASPYAVPAYLAMGFHATSEPYRKGGCVATRMAYTLSGVQPMGGASVA